MGFKRAMARMKHRIRKRRGFLLASILLLLVTVGVFWSIRLAEPALAGWSEEMLDRTILLHSYFGLDENHYLTLYEGFPEDGKVVCSYFQIDMAYMEDSLPAEAIQTLIRGIHVTDAAEYHSVLSTFSEYALD